MTDLADIRRVLADKGVTKIDLAPLVEEAALNLARDINSEGGIEDQLEFLNSDCGLGLGAILDGSRIHSKTLGAGHDTAPDSNEEL